MRLKYVRHTRAGPHCQASIRLSSHRELDKRENSFRGSFVSLSEIRFEDSEGFTMLRTDIHVNDV